MRSHLWVIFEFFYHIIYGSLSFISRLLKIGESFCRGSALEPIPERYHAKLDGDSVSIRAEFFFPLWGCHAFKLFRQKRHGSYASQLLPNHRRDCAGVRVVPLLSFICCSLELSTARIEVCSVKSICAPLFQHTVPGSYKLLVRNGLEYSRNYTTDFFRLLWVGLPSYV